MPITSSANIQASPSTRSTKLTPADGIHGNSWRITSPPCSAGYSSATFTAPASATSADRLAAVLRAWVGNRAATRLPAKGSRSSISRVIGVVYRTLAAARTFLGHQNQAFIGPLAGNQLAQAAMKFELTGR